MENNKALSIAILLVTVAGSASGQEVSLVAIDLIKLCEGEGEKSFLCCC